MTASNTPGPFYSGGGARRASPASRLIPGRREGAVAGQGRAEEGQNSRTQPSPSAEQASLGGGPGTVRVKKVPASGPARGRAGVRGDGCALLTLPGWDDRSAGAQVVK